MVRPPFPAWTRAVFSLASGACRTARRHLWPFPGSRSGAGALLAVLPCLAFGAGTFSQMPSRQMLNVTKCREGNVTRIFVENLEAAEVTATFELGLVNLRSSVPVPYSATFPPRQTVEAFHLSRICGDQEWSYTLTNYYTLGGTQAAHNDSFVYSLPYAAGQAFRVVQGYDGAFSHTGSERYAIDWQMPEGTPVLAARGGVVVATKDDSRVGGADRKLEACANYVLIEHPDGTIGNYAHLQAHSVRVHHGQEVAAGALVALSGNTGFSTGAHLHFCVFKAKSGRERQSIPTRFRTQHGPATNLLTGVSYTSPPTALARTQPRAGNILN